MDLHLSPCSKFQNPSALSCPKLLKEMPLTWGDPRRTQSIVSALNGRRRYAYGLWPYIIYQDASLVQSPFLTDSRHTCSLFLRLDSRERTACPYISQVVFEKNRTRSNKACGAVQKSPMFGSEVLLQNPNFYRNWIALSKEFTAGG